MDDTLSARINRAFNDPQRDDFGDMQMWTMVHEYVERIIVNRLHQDEVATVVADVLYQAAISLTKFEPRDDENGFTKWICGICRFRILDHLRNKYHSKEICISQIGSFGDDGNFIEMDFANLETPISEEHFSELLDRELKDARVNSALDALRKRIPPRDRKMFDLMRSGLSMKAAAAIVGLTRNSVNYHVRNWHKFAPLSRKAQS